MSDAVPGPGARYATEREAFVERIRALDADRLTTPVPACPGWTVHDVVAHLTGVAVDGVDGVTPEGAGLEGLDDWTARQVAQRADTDTAEVIAEWEQVSPEFERLLDSGSHSFPAELIDLCTHHIDVARTLDWNTAPTSVSHEVDRLLVHRWIGCVEQAGLPPLVILLPTHDPYAGPLDAPIRFHGTPRFIARAAMGRRSRRQILERFEPAEDLDRYVDELCIFPPRDDDFTG